MMNELPKTGEVWWLGDMVVLVLAVVGAIDSADSSNAITVKGVALLDIDDVFDPGEEVDWRVDRPGIHDNELAEPNRRIA